MTISEIVFILYDANPIKLIFFVNDDGTKIARAFVCGRFFQAGLNLQVTHECSPSYASLNG